MLPQPLARPFANPATPQSVVQALVLGTSPEEQEQGLYVGFDYVPTGEREQVAVTAELADTGVLTLEFLVEGARWGPGTLAGTSNQSFEFVDPLYATVFQFPAVTALDTKTMCWGELDCTVPFPRSAWESMVAGNQSRDVGTGCGLRGAWFDPACGSPVPVCGSELKVVPVHEGGLGAAIYGLELSAGSPCFVDWTGTAELIAIGEAELSVEGSPIDLHIRGLATADGFSTLNGSQPGWTMYNWCEGEALLSVELDGFTFEWDAGGRCDDPALPASLQWSEAREVFG